MPQSRTGGLFPQRFTLTIEEHPTIGWIVTTDAHKGFMQAIMPEEGLPEGLRKVPELLRHLLVAQMDAIIALAAEKEPTVACPCPGGCCTPTACREAGRCATQRGISQTPLSPVWQIEFIGDGNAVVRRADLSEFLLAAGDVADFLREESQNG